jgi:hypothetical protein
MFVTGEPQVRLAAQLKPLPEFQDRQAKRSRVSLEARMRELGTTGYDVHLLDVSTHGFKAERRDHFSAGAYVWLKVPGFPGRPHRLGRQLSARLRVHRADRRIRCRPHGRDERAGRGLSSALPRRPARC